MQTKGKKLSSHEKIVAIMANNKDKKWWYVHEIINAGNATDVWFIGYEGSARMAELNKKFPDMFETLDDGKFKKRRIRWEAMPEWFNDLPTSYRHIIHKTGRTHGVIRKDPHATKDDTEEPPKTTEYSAVFKGRSLVAKLTPNKTYQIKISRLTLGQPVSVSFFDDENKSQFVTYARIDLFRKDWFIQ